MPCGICKEDGHNRRTCQWAPPKYKNRKRSNHASHRLCFVNKSKSKKIHSTTSNHENCVICLDEIGQARCTLKCGHQYCTECFAQHIITNNKCPLCRDVILREHIPDFKYFKFIFYHSIDTYICSVRGKPTHNWKIEISSVILDNITEHLSRVNLATPSIVDEDGNTSDWLIYLIQEGIEHYVENIIEEYESLYFDHNSISMSPIIEENNEGSAINLTEVFEQEAEIMLSDDDLFDSTNVNIPTIVDSMDDTIIN